MSHGKSKHMEIIYHFLIDQIGKERLKIEYYKTELQLADILTKPLKQIMFEGLIEILGMRNLENLN